MKKILLLITVLTLLLLECSKEPYSYDDLISLPPQDLLQVFLDEGLEIQTDLLQSMDPEQLAGIFKSEFYLMTQGTTSLSHVGYAEMAKDVQEIYERIRK